MKLIVYILHTRFIIPAVRLDLGRMKIREPNV